MADAIKIDCAYPSTRVKKKTDSFYGFSQEEVIADPDEIFKKDFFYHSLTKHFYQLKSVSTSILRLQVFLDFFSI